MTFRPMLAGEADLKILKFPVWVSPKLDGVRATVHKGGVYSRSMKKIPNQEVQSLIHLKVDRHDPMIGMDGEIIIGDPTAPDVYRRTQSFCATAKDTDDNNELTFYVFDNFLYKEAYYLRIAQAFNVISAIRNRKIVALMSTLCGSLDELLAVEEAFLEEGYEGVILRSPECKYKNGRSTTKEQGMLKLKRFVDSEAEIIGIEEEMENLNVAKTNALGLTERSSHKENLRSKKRMGALVVRDLKTKIEFKIGTGFNAADRVWFYAREQNRNLKGVVVKYKHFAIGAKDKPRFPTYLGLRDTWDM